MILNELRAMSIAIATITTRSSGVWGLDGGCYLHMGLFPRGQVLKAVGNKVIA
ncbi:hypothetical protein IMCC26256_11523 [Actinobacteria bacterium IMCC26256]|nr:hypothetical protein IMCC26256_11523 [Actinobacteria bacterium IMCC26256]